MNTNPSIHAGANAGVTATSLEAAPLESSLNPAIIAARAAFLEIGATGLLEQCENARVAVDIGGVRTFWNRGISQVPPFLPFDQGGESFLLVWHAENSTLRVFKRRPESRFFEPVETVTKHSAIFARLPRYAFKRGASAIPASPAQLVALRKILRLDPEAALPDLHIASAARLMTAVVLEPTVRALCARHLATGVPVVAPESAIVSEATPS